MTGVFVQVGADAKRYVGYVIQENGCWNWTGASTRGYGRFKDDGRFQMAHRVLFQRHRGPIPEGLQLDHLCRNPACVNPDHLEPVTCRENLLRGDTAQARNIAKTECHRGHPFDAANTLRQADGSRRCRECSRISVRVLRARKRAAAPNRSNAAKTRCIRGHPFDEANTILRPDGARNCRRCRRKRTREWWRRNKGTKPIETYQEDA